MDLALCQQCPGASVVEAGCDGRWQVRLLGERVETGDGGGQVAVANLEHREVGRDCLRVHPCAVGVAATVGDQGALVCVPRFGGELGRARSAGMDDGLLFIQVAQAVPTLAVEPGVGGEHLWPHTPAAVDRPQRHLQVAAAAVDRRPLEVGLHQRCLKAERLWPVAALDAEVEVDRIIDEAQRVVDEPGVLAVQTDQLADQQAHVGANPEADQVALTHRALV